MKQHIKPHMAKVEIFNANTVEWEPVGHANYNDMTLQPLYISSYVTPATEVIISVDWLSRNNYARLRKALNLPSGRRASRKAHRKALKKRGVL